jgi:hypothetical protein
MLNKMKKLFFTISATALILPSFAFATTLETYTRTPIGSSITSPVTVYAKFSNMAGIPEEGICRFAFINSENLVIAYSDNFTCWDFLVGVTKDISVPPEYPQAIYRVVDQGKGNGSYSDDLWFETGSPAFTITGEATPTPTPPASYIISLPDKENMIASVSLATIGIFNDMSPVAMIIIGILLGLGLLVWVIARFKRPTRGQNGAR